jgi:hypothetical protein
MFLMGSIVKNQSGLLVLVLNDGTSINTIEGSIMFPQRYDSGVSDLYDPYLLCLACLPEKGIMLRKPWKRCCLLLAKSWELHFFSAA